MPNFGLNNVDESALLPQILRALASRVSMFLACLSCLLQLPFQDHQIPISSLFPAVARFAFPTFPDRRACSYTKATCTMVPSPPAVYFPALDKCLARELPLLYAPAALANSDKC
jgi:hypothetical protein